MIITTITEAKKHIGEMLWWDEHSSKYVITRSGVLDSVFNRQLSFDENYDYRVMSYYRDLRTTYKINQEEIT